MSKYDALRNYVPENEKDYLNLSYDVLTICF